MSSQGVQTVVADPFRFAEEGRHIHGKAAVGSMPRLAGLLESREGEIDYSLTGSLDADRTPRLALTIRGDLLLQCQRCLDGVQWHADIESVLQPYRLGQPIPDDELENDDVDAFEVVGDLNVVTLVEDEILLAMPIAPRHEACVPPGLDGGDKEESPFAALGKLKNGNA